MTAGRNGTRDSPPASMPHYLVLKERGSFLQVSLKGGAVSLNPEDRETAGTDGSLAFLLASTLLSPGVGRPGNLLRRCVDLCTTSKEVEKPGEGGTMACVLRMCARRHLFTSVHCKPFLVYQLLVARTDSKQLMENYPALRDPEPPNSWTKEEDVGAESHGCCTPHQTPSVDVTLLSMTQ